MLTHDQVNASSITKITSWLKFLGKNLRLVGCATVCAKSEVMLGYKYVATFSIYSLKIGRYIYQLAISILSLLINLLDFLTNIKGNQPVQRQMKNH